MNEKSKQRLLMLSETLIVAFILVCVYFSFHFRSFPETDRLARALAYASESLGISVLGGLFFYRIHLWTKKQSPIKASLGYVTAFTIVFSGPVLMTDANQKLTNEAARIEIAVDTLVSAERILTKVRDDGEDLNLVVDEEIKRLNRKSEVRH